MVRNRNLIDEAARRVAENLRYQKRTAQDALWARNAEYIRQWRSRNAQARRSDEVKVSL